MNTEPREERPNDADFIREKIKARPINKRLLFRRTIITAVLALVFGAVACLTFLLLEPFFTARLTPEEKPAVITFPTTDEEIQPEDLYADDAEIAAAQEQIVAETVAESVQASIEASEQSRVNEAITRAFSRYTLDENNADQMYRSLRAVSMRAESSLVLVRSAAMHNDFVGGVIEKNGEVPGIIIADNGIEVLILTYSSILGSDNDLSVTWCSGSSNKATVKMSDEATGLCTLSVSKRQLDAATIGQIAIAPLGSTISSSLTGTPVIAVGSPVGVYRSVCYGMVASEKIPIDLPDKSLRVYATDIIGATHARGFLMNYNCQIIGIIYQGSLENVDSDRIVAYSISDMKKLIEHLANNTPIGYMGIHGISITEDISDEEDIPQGAYVTRTDMNSPAMAAGIQSGDIITAAGDKQVNSWETLVSVTETLSPGDLLQINILRQGGDGYIPMQIELRLTEADGT